MEFKEVHKKNGQIIVFCNFEELLTEAFQVATMKEVEPLVNASTGEYICTCPFCKADHGGNYDKKKLYIKEDLNEGVGFCFRCTRRFINLTTDIDINFNIPKFNCFSNECSTDKEVILSSPEWSLDKFKYEFDDYDEKGVNYLKARNPYLEELYKILGFKFWDSNIAMPFYLNGNMVYYQIRFTGNSRIKYFFPPVSENSFKPPYIIEHGDNKKFIVCEGVYDAVSLLLQGQDYTPFAVLGSSITDEQLNILRKYVPEKIIVYMDKTELSKNIAKKIKQTIDYCPISIIPSDGTDPEENLQKRLRYGKLPQWIK